MKTACLIPVPVEEWIKTGTGQYYGTMNKHNVVQQSYYKEGRFYPLGFNTKPEPSNDITHVLVPQSGYFFTEEEMNQVESLFEESIGTDGSHHKQWYLHKIAETFGISINQDDKGTAP